MLLPEFWITETFNTMNSHRIGVAIVQLKNIIVGLKEQISSQCCHKLTEHNKFVVKTKCQSGTQHGEHVVDNE